MSESLNSLRIIIVETDALECVSLVRKFTGLGYACTCCENASVLLKILGEQEFDLVLMDISNDMSVSKMNGKLVLRKILDINPDIAVILITSSTDIRTAVDFIKEGAYDWITRPFGLEEIVQNVSRAFEKQRLLKENSDYQRMLEEQVVSRTNQLQEALRVLEHTYHSTLAALSRALDNRDKDSDGSSALVHAYAKRLCQQLDLNEKETRIIEYGALLHDIGKIGVPDGLLKKKEKLTEEEELVMRKHPDIGYYVLSGIKFLKEAAALVRQHHERYDGLGYPQGLSGEKIEYGARVITVVDTFVELVTENSEVEDFEAAAKEIANQSGSRLDPYIVEEFMKIPLEEWMRIHNATTRKTRFVQALQAGEWMQAKSLVGDQS